MNKRLLFAMPIVMLAASVASAHYHYYERDLIQPYGGVDAQLRTMSFEREFGRNLFAHHFPQGNIYAGLKFGDFLAIEAGYEATIKKSRDIQVNQGETILGRTVEFQQETHEGSISVHGWHLNLVGFLPICDLYNISLIGSVGIVGLTAKLNDTLTQVDEETNFASRNFSQCKNLLRLGVGISQLFNDCVGFRAMVYWENTRRFAITDPTRPQSLNFIRAKDSIIYSLGLFVHF